MSNSNPEPKPSIVGTLAGGIQDVSAILPIIGTDQCERHVGSALTGGFLYAASAPLSIFGCLGIIKVAIGILIASISIPRFWVSHRDLKPSGPNGKGKQSMLFGAELLQNIGFQLAGNAAPLIGMDGTRFMAETKLIQILEEKHINKPHRVSISWKSTQWNIMLVLSTVIAAAMSGIPYFALLLGPESWRPTTHLSWLFPILRTLGSCLASVCCQFIIQSRVISTMKNRILFMTFHRQLESSLSPANEENLDDWLNYHLQWDSNLPAEQCIRNIQQALSRYRDISEMGDDVQPTGDHISIDMAQERSPPKPRFQNPGFPGWWFEHYLNMYFPSRNCDRVTAFISWVVLFLSLPATVAGYIGCFTLVSSSPSPGNGPLVWIGLEAALSIIRILIWAWNPKFDEDTDVTVGLELDEDGPSDWIEELNGFVDDLESKKSKSLPLRTEQQFLKEITAFTGPLDQFQRPDNNALYYTLMADGSIRTEKPESDYIALLVTLVDFNTAVGVTLLQLGGSFYYFDADAPHDAALKDINATVYSTMRNIHSWKMQMGNLFNSLEQHYICVVSALNPTQKNPERNKIAKFERKWDLSVKPTLTTWPSTLHFLSHSLVNRDHSYEHNFKANLIRLWSRWVNVGMEEIEGDARQDCYEALEDRSTKKAKWELTELDRLVAQEWSTREQVVIAFSLDLEEILRAKLELCIKEQEDEKLKGWMRTEFVIGRRKRLENDRGEAKRRMKMAMHRRSALAERERRSWKGDGQFAPKWQEGMELIDTLWSEGISKGPTVLKDAEANLDALALVDISCDVEGTYRHNFVAQVKQRFEHWRSQREEERREMEATKERIRWVGNQREQLDSAYKYPEPDYEAPLKFVRLAESTSQGKACSAIVYDTSGSSADVVYDAIKKNNTRSVIRVHRKIFASIPPNDHLLYLSCAEGGQEPAFVQRNRDRWWDQQTSNSALFYFTPQGTSGDSCVAYTSGPIAQVFIFLAAPSRIRLRLLHFSDTKVILSVQESGKDPSTFSGLIVGGSFKLQTFDLGELTPGRHELQVSASMPDYVGSYHLRNILIDFLDCPAQNPISSAFEDKDRADEICPATDAVAGEQGSGDFPESPTPLPIGQNSGLVDHTVTRIHKDH